MSDTAKVQGHANLVRDLKSSAIINTDSDAYARYMARKAKIKLESLSVTKTFNSEIFAQTIVVRNPTNKPAMIPLRVVFFHQRAITKAGPNAEPNPLQA